MVYETVNRRQNFCQAFGWNGCFSWLSYITPLFNLISHSAFSCGEFLLQGESPYNRSTYRYTPLLAWLLTPNIYLNMVFGKILFIVCDVLSGLLIYKVLCLRGLRAEVCDWHAFIMSLSLFFFLIRWAMGGVFFFFFFFLQIKIQKYIFACLCSDCTLCFFFVASQPVAHGRVQPRECWVNPGSSGAGDSALHGTQRCGLNISALIWSCVFAASVFIGSFCFLPAQRLTWAALLYGLSVHMKIYPVTYALPIALTLRTAEIRVDEAKKVSRFKKLVGFFVGFFNQDLLLFASVAGGVFFTLTALFYYMWDGHHKPFSWFRNDCSITTTNAIGISING